MEQVTYTTKGVCSRKIIFTVNNGIITSLAFQGGCSGNLQGIGRLVEGMAVKDVIARLKGLDCGGKGTSCPDQLAKALEDMLAQESKAV